MPPGKRGSGWPRCRPKVVRRRTSPPYRRVTRCSRRRSIAKASSGPKPGSFARARPPGVVFRPAAIEEHFKTLFGADLEMKLAETQSLRNRIIVTDGSFSMDGTIAQLDTICNLADKYDAIVMIDECHSSGFIGKTGRGTHEYRGVMGRIDIITGTLGKALGGASGGLQAEEKR